MDDGPNPVEHRRSGARWGIAVAAIVLLGTTVAALSGDVLPAEAPLLRGVNGAHPVARVPLQAVQYLGASLALLGLTVVLALVGRWRVAATLVAAWVTARVASTVLKAVVDRGRPPGLVDGVVVRQHLPVDEGFPSAHAAHAAAAAVVLAWAWPPLRGPLAVVAVLVGLGRLAVGVHLPLDLLGGWSLGVLAAALAISVVAPRVPVGPAATDR